MPFIGRFLPRLGPVVRDWPFFCCWRLPISTDERGASARSSSAQGSSARGRLGIAGGLSLYLGCLFAGSGVALPYLNPWLASRGITVEQLALIASTSAVVRIIAGPLIGFLADRTQNHRHVLIVIAWAWAISWLLLREATVFWQVLGAQMLIAITGAALIPLGDTLALAGVRAGLMDYGRVRLWGSVTFLIATLAGGAMVERLGLEAVIVYICVAAFFTALSTLLLPPLAVTRTASPPRLADAYQLISMPVFAGFLVAAGAAQACHATLYVYSTLHWQSLGLSATWCGVLWAIGVAAEIALFWWAAKLPAALTPLRLLALGLAGGVVRWTIMGFDPPLTLLMPLQLLHAATFAAAHLGAMQFIARAVPPAQAGTAQSVYTVATAGVGMALATQAAGHVYASAAGRSYWVMALISAVGLVVCQRLIRHWDGGVLSATEPRASGPG